MAFSLEHEHVARTRDRAGSNNEDQMDESKAIDVACETPSASLDQGTDIQEIRSATVLSEESMPKSHQRLETLIEQQNALLLQQLQLAEKNAERHGCAPWRLKTFQDILETLDPELKSIFVLWRKQFRATVAVYISLSRKYSKLQDVASKGELVQPFSRDARQTWDWPEIYLSVAQPLQSPDFDHAVDPNGEMDSSDNADVSTAPKSYDVNEAFAELRKKHAWESQTFVLSHQKACVEKLLENLSLECQSKMLQSRIDAWVVEQRQLHPSQVKQELESQAKAFVEVVHRVEIQKAEAAIKEQFAFPTSFLLGLRVAVVLSIFLAVTNMSHESLMRCFAILFGLGCGVALLWEDVLILSVRLLFGYSMKRLETYRSHASQLSVNLPVGFWQ